MAYFSNKTVILVPPVQEWSKYFDANIHLNIKNNNLFCFPNLKNNMYLCQKYSGFDINKAKCPLIVIRLLPLRDPVYG